MVERFRRFGDRKGGEGEGSAVEGDVAFGNEGGVEGEGEGEEEADRISVGGDGEESCGAVDVTLLIVLL